MDQSAILPPKVTSGHGYSWPYTLYLYAAAVILRNVVSYMTAGEKFDREISIGTPGLGAGKVRCCVCVPAEDGSELAPKPLTIVLEGGGFVLGEPKDGWRNDRKLADEVPRRFPSSILFWGDGFLTLGI